MEDINIGKHNTDVINSLYIGKTFINNCKIRKKIIYDIKPLNKSEKKGRCIFPLKEIRNNTDNKDKIELNLIENKPIMRNALTEKKSINDYGFQKTKEIKKKIHLNDLLYKDISHNLKELKLKTFYSPGSGDTVRGEKIKFLKTCSPVNLIKPIMTQKGYIFKSSFVPKKLVKAYSSKKNNFNDYDKVKKRNQHEIKDIENKLKSIRKNIIRTFKLAEERNLQLFKFKTEGDDVSKL